MKLKLLRTLTPVGLKELVKYRGYYSPEAMTHPGRMRVTTALDALRFLSEHHVTDLTVFDPTCGVGTTAIAVAILKLGIFWGCDFDPRWFHATQAMLREHFSDLPVALFCGPAVRVDRVFPHRCVNIVFFSPEFPMGADLLVAELDRMDLFAAHEVAQTHTLEVLKADGSEWSEGEANAFIQAIVDDFMHDGVQPDLSYESDDGTVLTITGDWDAEEE